MKIFLAVENHENLEKKKLKLGVENPKIHENHDCQHTSGLL